MFGGLLAFPVIGLAAMSWLGPASIRGPASLLVLLYLLQIVLVATGTRAGLL